MNNHCWSTKHLPRHATRFCQWFNNSIMDGHYATVELRILITDDGFIQLETSKNEEKVRLEKQILRSKARLWLFLTMPRSTKSPTPSESSEVEAPLLANEEGDVSEQQYPGAAVGLYYVLMQQSLPYINQITWRMMRMRHRKKTYLHISSHQPRILLARLKRACFANHSMWQPIFLIFGRWSASKWRSPHPLKKFL